MATDRAAAGPADREGRTGHASSDGARRSYHHGNLREAILAAVVRQVGEVGPEGVSLRAAAKAVGVSPAAAFRHFADKRAVMTAVAIDGFRGMVEHVRAECEAAQDDPADRFHALGAAYVAYALAEPERFRVMFRGDLVDGDDAALREAGEALREALTDGLRPLAPNDDDAAFGAKALLAWAAVHGLATLSIEGALDDVMPLEHRRAALTGIVWGMLPVFTNKGVPRPSP